MWSPHMSTEGLTLHWALVDELRANLSESILKPILLLSQLYSDRLLTNARFEQQMGGGS